MKTSYRLSRLVVACIAVVAVCGLVATAAWARPAPQTAPGDPLDPRTYAPDTRLFLILHAIGVQKYTCQANGTWLFTDPEATLYKTTGVLQPIGTHYLNFVTGRPVWQLDDDGSSVEAARVAMASGGSGNIAWLLLQAVATGDGRLGRTTYVQRLNTSGGVAPAGTCTPGATIAVPYTADYFFWKAHQSDGTPADPPRYRSSTLNWHQSDKIYLTGERTLRVLGVRDDDADQPPAPIVEDLPGTATSATG